MHFVFDEPVHTFFSFSGLWDNVTDHEWVLNSTAWSFDHNYALSKGQPLKVDFMGSANGSSTPGVCVFLEQFGNEDCNGSVVPVIQPPTSDVQDYGDALRKSILFYDAQRSGRLPRDNPVRWRHDSGLQDCVVGGWYDGGDYIKATFPLASAATLLLWGVHRFQDGYARCGQLDAVHGSVRWALDYLLQAWDPFRLELVVQIGDVTVDHLYWGRPEDMTMSRPCLKINPRTPGSDVAGQTAAALAAGAIVYLDRGDNEYARQLLNAAESIYEFATSHQGLYSTSLPGTASYYKSTSYLDELCLAAAWLYKATGRPEFLTAAALHLDSSLAWALDWNDKKVLCQILLFEETGSDHYKQEVLGFLRGWQRGPGGHLTYTPCGLAWFSDRGSNSYAANAAFVALLAAEAGLNNNTNRAWAAQQINYILGDNSGCYSYQIGHGHAYPLFPPHRAASCPTPPDPCTAAALSSARPNPHILVGAVVGGPSVNDTHTDDRHDDNHNGVYLVHNAGFQSAVAGLLRLQEMGHFPNVTTMCPCTQ